VEAVMRHFDDPVFAARQSSLASLNARRFSPGQVMPSYADLLVGLIGERSGQPTGGTKRSGTERKKQFVNRLARFAAEHPWPKERPIGANADEHQGWFGAGTDTALARVLSDRTRLVVELGSWLGLSTRFICRHAPRATVVCVDHWQGSPEHLNDPRFQELLPLLYETFLTRSWNQRSRVIPLRTDTLSGLKAVAAAGLQPDVIFVDADHSFQAVTAELSLSRKLFPAAILAGDDYDWQSVRQAVDGFARNHGMLVDRHGTRGWRLLEKWQANEAVQPPAGRAQSFVLVPHLNGIEWECEQALRQLETAGVRVVRRGGCSAIDVARNELLSDALHDGAEAMLFIDADLGFDPQDALRLLARPEEVVTGVYAKKSRREMATFFADGIKQVQFGGSAQSLYPLKFAAAGFMRLRAGVLRRMISELCLPLCNTHWGRGIWPFFQPLIIPHDGDKLHYLGEDWAFSHRLSQIGVTPLADTSIRLWHWGRYGFGWEDAGQEIARFTNYLLNI
jgi:predicted O-methyltransferase YrrM